MTEPAESTHLIQAVAGAARAWLDHGNRIRREAIDKTLGYNNSFTEPALERAVDLVMASITGPALESWLNHRTTDSPKRVAVLNAGNVPFVGLQDLLAVLLTGHFYQGVLSSKSPKLMPAFTGTVRDHGCEIRGDFVDLPTALAGSDALVATGADATVTRIAARATTLGIPASHQLLRGTRTSIAVLDGEESDDELASLAEDVLLHDGRGCLNVSMVLAGSHASRAGFVKALKRFRVHYPPHATTLRNLAREQRFLRATGQSFDALSGAIVVSGGAIPRVPGVVVWNSCQTLAEAQRWIQSNTHRIQAVVASSRIGGLGDDIHRVEPGQSQAPAIDWRPDGRDTIDFLVGL